MGGTPVVWKSSKQTVIALSTMEAEYVAMAQCAREVTWIKQFLISLSLQDKNQPITLWSDSQAAIAHAENYIDKSRTKHISIKYHFIREKVMDRVIDLQYVSTTRNIADLLTKALGPKSYDAHRGTTEKTQQFK